MLYYVGEMSPAEGMTVWIHRGRPLRVLQNAIRIKTDANEVVPAAWRTAEGLQTVGHALLQCWPCKLYCNHMTGLELHSDIVIAHCLLSALAFMLMLIALMLRCMQTALHARQALLPIEQQWAKLLPGGQQCRDGSWVNGQLAKYGDRARLGMQQESAKWAAQVAALQPSREQALAEYIEACRNWLQYIDTNLKHLPNNYCGMTIQVEVRQGPGLPVLRLDVGHQFREGFAAALAQLDEVHMPAYALQGRQLQAPLGAALPQL